MRGLFSRNKVLNIISLVFLAFFAAALVVFFQYRSFSSTPITIISPYKNYQYYYKGNLHDHSTGSDGNLSPKAVADRYASFGYGFYTQADHNKVTGGYNVGKMVNLGGAEELSLYNDKTHVLLSVISGGYAKNNSSTVAAAKAGAIVVVNHFNTSDKRNPGAMKQ